MPKILLAEDSASQAKLMTMMLQNHGFDVTHVVDGRRALQELSDNSYDLVVTDMQMPEVNGAELIALMRSQFPEVPAVLTTAHGSEALAADALASGAVSYVSKTYLAELLVDIVSRAAALGLASKNALELKGVLQPQRFEFTSDNRLQRIDPLVCLIVQLLTVMRALRTNDRVRIGNVLAYVLCDAVYHGNLEQPRTNAPIRMSKMIEQAERTLSEQPALLDRGIACSVNVTSSQVSLEIQHDGPCGTLHEGPVPGTPASFESERGRGLLLITSVMDEVLFNRSGTCVTLVKHLQ